MINLKRGPGVLGHGRREGGKGEGSRNETFRRGSESGLSRAQHLPSAHSAGPGADGSDETAAKNRAASGAAPGSLEGGPSRGPGRGGPHPHPAAARARAHPQRPRLSTRGFSRPPTPQRPSHRLLAPPRAARGAPGSTAPRSPAGSPDGTRRLPAAASAPAPPGLPTPNRRAGRRRSSSRRAAGLAR